jgi:hypothetical protein
MKLVFLERYFIMLREHGFLFIFEPVLWAGVVSETLQKSTYRLEAR